MPYRWCLTVLFRTLAAASLLMLPSLAVAQTPGLVGAYAFNETSGTTAADASGTGNNGVLTSGALFTAGKTGNGVGLDGVNDYVNLGNRTSLRITGSMTLSAWVKSSAFPPDDAAIISKRQSSNIGYQLDTTADRGPRTIGFKINSVARYGATTMAANTWYHVAGVYNATNRTMAVYLNGQLDNGALVGTVPATQLNSNQNVNLGRRPGTPGTFNFAGVLDDVRIYNRALSLAEIQTDMLTPVGGTPPPNTPPTISSIVAPAINEDTATGALAFTVGDLETPAGSLTVSGSSSNPTLVPAANIVFGGSGANRTVTITPAPNQNGTATITVTVSDGQLSTPTSFLLTVNAVNDSPTITSIPNQTTSAGTAVGPLSFTVGDVETPAASLTLTRNSSNQTLVPTASVVFGGSGAARTVTITPAANQAGTATITVTVSDGQLNTATSFLLTVGQVAGLAAGWNFNEGTGAVALDLSGNNNTASVSNPLAWTAGHYGGGLGFSGADFVTVANSPSLDISGNALTLSMWVNPQPPAQGDDVLLAKLWNSTQTSPFYQYGIELDQGSVPRFYVGTAAGPLSAGMGSSLPFGQWNHLAVVFDGSQVLFYLNASLVSTQPLAATLTARGQRLNIGADGNGSQLFHGTLDDVRIYPRVLTQADINADMLTPLGGVSGSDVTPPTVAISSPANNTQVSDIVTVTANAADDTAVAGVQFLVDGVNVGVEDTAAPYGVSWDTRTVTNGAHTLTARARSGLPVK